MKKIYLVLFLVLWLMNGFAQGNTIWVDSILTKIMLNEIEIYDEDFKAIRFTDIELTKKDTVVNDMWTRPKYINNILQNSFAWILIDEPTIFDTCANQNNNEYIDFKFRQYDGYDNYENVILFTMKRNSVKIDSNKLVPFDGLVNTAWKIDAIFRAGKNIKLDSCHFEFILIINEDCTFVQHFGKNKYDCSTQSMNEDIEVGIEGEDSFSFAEYHDKIQGHYLSVRKGIWKIENENLLLIDLDRRKTLSYRIEKFNKRKLFFNIEGSNYFMKMKKAIR